MEGQDIHWRVKPIKGDWKSIDNYDPPPLVTKTGRNKKNKGKNKKESGKDLQAKPNLRKVMLKDKRRWIVLNIMAP